jgi:hypothetical protein
MTTKQNPLLCELHAHTTWSDGALGVRDPCDLYGRRLRSPRPAYLVPLVGAAQLLDRAA